MTRRAAVAGVIGVMGVASVLVLWRAPETGQPAAAPRFEAWTVAAEPAQRSLDDYAGAPVLLNVWATWCDPCREEMPSLQRLHEADSSRGLRIVAVSIDDAGQVGLIKEFAAEHGLTFDILHDSGGAIMRQYPVRGVPQTFLISREGRIVATRYVEDWFSERNRRLVDSLLLAGR